MTSKADYLKKYLSADESKKKRIKKKKSKVDSRLKIVDEDVDLRKLEDSDDEAEELLLPSIQVVDTRPALERELDNFASNKWKKIVADPIDEVTTSQHKRHDSDNSSDADETTSVTVGTEVASTRTRHDSDDSSPPRKQLRNDSDADLSPPRTSNRANDDDLSPPRKGEDEKDLSPPRQQSKRKNDDLSPPRRNSRNVREDLSPPRSNNRSRRVSDDLSPPRSSKSAGSRRDRSKSPDHRRKDHRRRERSRSRSRERRRSREGDVRPVKTLAGAKAGLQTAADMRREADDLKQREDDNFRKISDVVSGKHAAPVVRAGGREDRKKKKEPTEEELKRTKAMEEKYQKWNKGVKQLEDRDKKVAEVLHEMDKPVARFKDDVDLEAMLKEQELKEDPMYAYMQKKKQKANPNQIVFPKYTGPAAPLNRFGILPGHRWDGVDRSNGFEVKVLTKDNDRKADAEEFFKWSYGSYD